MTLIQEHWQPNVTVATVVAQNGHLLLVEETIDGVLMLNQPAGHLELGESLLQAARRETLEETGWKVRLTSLIGSYLWTPPTGCSYLRFAFAAEPLTYYPQHPLDASIVRALWLTPLELQAATVPLRSPLVWRVVTDYLSGQHAPLDLVQYLP
ncbi:MAG TPA: NUDIX hydrolase [Xylella taiwanensis]